MHAVVGVEVDRFLVVGAVVRVMGPSHPPDPAREPSWVETQVDLDVLGGGRGAAPAVEPRLGWAGVLEPGDELHRGRLAGGQRPGEGDVDDGAAGVPVHGAAGTAAEHAHLGLIGVEQVPVPAHQVQRPEQVNGPVLRR